MTETRPRLLIALLASLSLPACQPSTQDASPGDAGSPADLVLQGGKFFTVDEAQVWAEAVAIKDGRFVYVGDDAGAQGFVGADTDLHDLGGKLTIPGLVDSHTHPGYMGRYSPPGSLPRTSKADILAAVKAYAEENPDLPWIIMCCWPVTLYGDGRDGPHKSDLDAIAPDRPVWLGSNIGHSVWVNSKALELMGVDRDTPDPKPGLALYVRDADGELTGWIKESAFRPFRNKFFEVDAEVYQEGMVTFLDYLANQGVTTLYDGGNGYYNDVVYSFLAELDRAGKLPVRYEGTYHIFLPGQEDAAVEELLRLRDAYGGDRLRFNTVKIHFDGSNENRTGAVLEPFSDDPGNRGNTLLDTEELRDFLLRLHESELDLHLHTVGDRAVRIALDAVEAARESLGGDLYTRVAVCHLDIIDTSDYPRFKQLGVIASYTPHMARPWGPTTGDCSCPRSSLRQDAAGPTAPGRWRGRDLFQRRRGVESVGERQPLSRDAGRPQPPVRPGAGCGCADTATDDRTPGPGGSDQGIYLERRLSASNGGPARLDRGRQARRSGRAGSEPVRDRSLRDP